AGENHRQLFWRNDFELVIGAVAWLLVRAPPAKLRRVTEAVALHVVISDFDDQLGTERLPRQVLALAPAALAAGHALPGFTALWCMLGPIFPRVSGECVLAVWSEEFHQLAPLLFREARADSDMLQCAGVVEKAEQERADHCALTFFVPAKAGNDTVALAFVFDLEHHALVGLVGPRNRLGDDAVETSALEATKPVSRYAGFAGCGCQVQWRRTG